MSRFLLDPRRAIAVLLSLFLLSACTSTKNIAYFQDVSDSVHRQKEAMAQVPVTPVIQPDDILFITVSAPNPAAAAPYNQGSASGAATQYMGETSTTESTFGKVADMRLGYLVDKEGTINFPGLGRLNLRGLTLVAAQDTMAQRLQAYIRDPLVNIRFLNYKITVLGEVLHPGTFSIPNQQITLLQALGMAGDMTIFGKRTNVLVIREDSSKREYGRINLNDSKELFNSPFYYLQQNDVVYVEPRKSKVWNTDNAGLRTASILVTILSALSIIATRF